MTKISVSRHGEQTDLFSRALRTDHMWERMQGLLGRESLNAGEALWITPCSSIHMLFMRFAIDVAFLDRRFMIVKLATYQPWSFYGGHLRAHSVLEMPLGSIALYQLQVGQTLLFREAEPHQGCSIQKELS